MKDFFKDYVEMISETNAYECDEATVNKVVDAICANDEIWDMIDSYIMDCLDHPERLPEEDDEQWEI